MLSRIKNVAPSETSELRQAAGVWLRDLRETAGLSQRELATRLELEYYTFISQLENGRGRIPPQRYRDWARALNVDDKVFAERLLSYYEPVIYDILFNEVG